MARKEVKSKEQLQEARKAWKEGGLNRKARRAELQKPKDEKPKKK